MVEQEINAPEWVGTPEGKQEMESEEYRWDYGRTRESGPYPRLSVVLTANCLERPANHPTIHRRPISLPPNRCAADGLSSSGNPEGGELT